MLHWRWLRLSGLTSKKQGWPDPLVGDSGNGGHLVYPLDLSLEEETSALLKAVLDGLARRYADQLARLNLELDQAVFNPARLTKLYGTMARKGDHTPDRPHRLSRIISLPEARQPVSRELLESIAQDTGAQEAPRDKRDGRADGSLDLAAYLNHYNSGRGEGEAPRRRPVVLSGALPVRPDPRRQ